MGLFGVAARWWERGGGQKSLLSEICHSYPSLILIHTDTYFAHLCLTYKRFKRHINHVSRNASIFHQKSAFLVKTGKAGIDCILMHKF